HSVHRGQALLAQFRDFGKKNEVLLLLRWTPYCDDSTIVYVGLLVHRRVLPLAWKIMPPQETSEQGQWELVRELVAQVAPSFPAANCTLLADRGLSCLELIHICKQVQWHYVLRISQEHLVRRLFKRGYQDWQLV